MAAKLILTWLYCPYSIGIDKIKFQGLNYSVFIFPSYSEYYNKYFLNLDPVETDYETESYMQEFYCEERIYLFRREVEEGKIAILQWEAWQMLLIANNKG